MREASKRELGFPCREDAGRDMTQQRTSRASVEGVKASKIPNGYRERRNPENRAKECVGPKHDPINTRWPRIVPKF
jgi:hypothetical protein